MWSAIQTCFQYSTRFLCASVLCIALVLTPPVYRVVRAVVAQVAATVLATSTERVVAWELRPQQIRLRIQAADPLQGDATVSLAAFAHLANIPIFWAILCTFTRRWWRRQVLVAAGSGTALLCVLDGLILASEGWELCPTPIRPPHTWAYHVLATFGILHAVGGSLRHPSLSQRPSP